MRPITWRFWAGSLALVGAYFLLGAWFSSNAEVEANLYKWGLLGAAAAVTIFIAIYTGMGLRGYGKWWRNDAGTNLVLVQIATLPVTVPLAWVFWVDHGVLTNTWLAWIEVGGPCFSTILLIWRSQIWIRNAQETTRKRNGYKEVDQESKGKHVAK